MSSAAWVGAVNTQEEFWGSAPWTHTCPVNTQELFGVQLLGAETFWALLSQLPLPRQALQCWDEVLPSDTPGVHVLLSNKLKYNSEKVFSF